MPSTTRKLSYCNDDRAMHLIYMGALKIFESRWVCPRLLFPIFNGLLFRLILWMRIQNLKFVALPAPEIIGGLQKNLGSPWKCPCSLFSKIFNGLLFGWTLWMYQLNLKCVALPVPGIRVHSHWHECRLRVTRTRETRTSGAFTITRTSTDTCNPVAIRNLVKIVKYLEFLAKVYSTIADNVVPNCLRQNYVISSLCAV